MVSVDERRFVDRDTGEIVESRLATAEQLRDFAIAARQSIPRMSEDELDQLEALLVAVAKRLRQLGKHAAEAEFSRALALRRIGELLGPGKHVAGPGRGKPSPNGDGFTKSERNRRHAARLLAEFSELVDAEIERQRAQEQPTLSVSRLVKLCQIQRATRDMPVTDQRFPILYADPPWRYDGAESANRQIENQYGTMSLDAIKALAIPAAGDAVLFLWATSPKLVEGLDVLRAWGFQYRTCMVWVKDKIGMGYYARQQHELLLIGKRGELPAPQPENRPASIFHADREQHSAKPEIVYELIEMSPTQRRRAGWRPGDERSSWPACFSDAEVGRLRRLQCGFRSSEFVGGFTRRRNPRGHPAGRWVRGRRW